MTHDGADGFPGSSDDSRQRENPSPGEGAQAPPGAQTPEDLPQDEEPPQDEWYYSLEGVSYGPVSEGQLVALARAGYFGDQDYVYAGYIGEWVRADSVHGLFDTVGSEVVPPEEPLYVPPPGAPPQPVVYTEYAGFWIRFVSAFVDGLVLFFPNCFICSLFQGLYFMPAGRFSAGPDGDIAQMIAGMVAIMVLGTVGIVISWLYFATMESSRWQATLGKRAVGIMVTDINGDRITFGRATGRYFASILSGMTLNIGYIMGAFTARKQTLHDILCNTVVIYGNSSSSR